MLTSSTSNSNLAASGSTADLFTRSVFGSKWTRRSIPRLEMPEDEMPPSAAYQLIHDELQVRGTASSTFPLPRFLFLAFFWRHARQVRIRHGRELTNLHL
jgi:hypothetical protein